MMDENYVPEKMKGSQILLIFLAIHSSSTFSCGLCELEHIIYIFINFFIDLYKQEKVFYE